MGGGDIRGTFEDVSLTVGDITYTVDLDDEAHIARITDVSDPAEAGTVTIPSTFTYENATYTTTELKWGAFSAARANVAGLKLPNTLTSVSAQFRKFPNVTELTIPGSVTTFSGSFQNMKKLERLVFEEGLEEIDARANSMVSGCTSLKTIKLPQSLKRIKATAAFSGATALESISLPEGLTEVGINLFQGCTSLKSVKLPSGLTEIPQQTFSGCEKLESVTATSPITSIGSSAFFGCAALTSAPSLSSVTQLGSNAFDGCKSLQLGDLDLSGLTTIPSYAFQYVAGITSITFSGSLTSIGTCAFVWAGVSEIKLPSSLTSIGSYAFYYASNLGGTVSIPDGVTSLGKSAFEGSKVECFEIGSGLTDVDASALASSSLKAIYFKNSADGVTITGDLPVGVTPTYAYPSIDDTVGDTIANESTQTLQGAVNAASDGAETEIRIDKHVKLSQPVKVPRGKRVTITSNGEFQISGTKVGGLKNLFVVEQGASLTVSGKVTLFGKYNAGSVVLSRGSFELSGEAVVMGSRITNDYANDTNSAGLGVLDARGQNASITLSGGKVTDNSLSSSSVSYSGIVRVSNGATLAMTGGEVSGNDASVSDALNTTAGILLYGNASGSMSGGTIAHNKGHRGAGVMLFGSDSTNRTTFTLSGNGSIEQNEHTSKGSDAGSGAVHVESNAEFTMEGGSIKNNKGVMGAGVCVVDGNLQIGASEYKTALIMNGGEISGNAGLTGGGIYSYSNGVQLNAGTISNNTASNIGGGIYSEGNTSHYSTLYMKNALITGNTARQGGGMWFCPTGETAVYVSEGAALYGNKAKDSDAGKAAGDDFVFSSVEGDASHPATLANRMLGGGSVTWLKDGSVYMSAGGAVYPSTSESVPRYGQEGASTEPVLVNGATSCLALKAIPFSEEMKDLARSEAKLVITGNTADKGGGVGANGGIVIGEEGETSVKVVKQWAGDSEADRPRSVTVKLLSNGMAIDSAELSADNGWKHEFTGLPVKDSKGTQYAYTVEEVQVAGYTSKVSGDAALGFVITNTKTGGSGGDETSKSLTAKKVWKLDDGGSAAASVTIELLRDGKPYETAELNEACGWSKTWSALSARHEWAVVETNVPSGFTSSVSHQGDVWTITNDDTPQPVDPNPDPAPEPDPDPTPDPDPDPNPDSPSDPSADASEGGDDTLPQTGDSGYAPAITVGVVAVLCVILGLILARRNNK